MKLLHIAVIVKSTLNYDARDCRNMGHFSYEVPEFTWEFIAPGKGVTLDTAELKTRGFDLIFVEDGGSYPDFRGNAIPNVFYSIDSTLSDDHHFAPRFDQARKADLVLVDHDRLERFEPCGRPVRRLLYAVNDKLFYPRAKTIDVNFQCGGGGGPERAAMRIKLDGICKANGWSYRSGTSPLAEYAETMGRSKVVVVVPRTPTNRPHRVYDALASGAWVLSPELPYVDVQDAWLRPDYEYASLSEGADLKEQLKYYVIEDEWEGDDEVGLLGNEDLTKRIRRGVSWSTRAAELRQMLSQELGL